MPQGDGHADQRGGDVQQEDPAPARPVHQPATEERSDGGPDAAEARPQADGPGPVGGVEGGLDDRQRTGSEQRPADALEHAGRDEDADVRGQPANQRRGGEPHHADDEDPPAPEAVAERAAEQDQPGQREHVAVDGPLERGEARVQVTADGRQGDVDDRRVQQGHAGPEDRRQQDPLPRRGGDPQGRSDGGVGSVVRCVPLGHSHTRSIRKGPAPRGVPGPSVCDERARPRPRAQGRASGAAPT